ncbi:bifunctional diguanylate cyclase/phosphodiesterase [Candidatus Methylobacter oryzae]|uniref:EAL domain-containing protein n=1 Tax=Candidatus Methylobacter oryzae TaxID=2497749 RepID=A0ABY3C559_9GAMM|nr:EAL domain-containing protein [Candidatus Methylobacter oryzae]TRW89998.1 EAL domain-containing protein [Candidatus Methylobacter oryzae]
MIDVLHFQSSPPAPNFVYLGSYDPAWIIISVLLAIFASYAALNASARIEHLHESTSKLSWTMISAVTLGVGIWSMHFIGMLALSLPCSIHYDPLITLISMIPSILASGVALGIVRRHGSQRLPPLIGSVLLGSGIGLMHYSGMAAMRLEGTVRYDLSLFVLSIAVAIGLSYLALRVKSDVICINKRRNAVVAVIMGGAVSGMHYTAMSASYFVRDDMVKLPSPGFTTNNLPIFIALTTVFLALAVLVLAAFSSSREMTKQFRNSEERWKFALEGAGDGVWDWNLQTGDALFSERWKEMLGYSEHELPDIRTIWIEDIHPNDKRQALTAVRKHFAGNQPFFVIEYRIRCKDGSWKWILARGKLVSRDANGRPYRMIGTHTDITDRKHSEHSLQRSESKFRTLFDSTSDAVILLDETGFLDCNKATLALFGFETLEAFCAKQPNDLSPPKQACGSSSLVLARQHIDTAMKKGGLCFEWLHKRADNGEIFPAEVLLSPMKLNGNPVLQATVRDISERKQAETELRIAATAFESQEGIMVIDADKIILRVNRAFTRITGYSAEEVIGKSPRLFQSGLQDEAFYAAMAERLKNKGNWEGEIWNQRKNGEIYPEYLIITAVKNKDDVVTNYVATLIDITLNKKAEDEIQRLAFYDPLTNLPNRRLLLDRLNLALASSHRSGRTGALLFIDLDNFKTLNDTLGHDMGDLMLQQVAERLSSCIREGDTVARLGGDEFVVMLEGLSTQAVEAAAQTEMIGEKILATLNQPYQLAQHEYYSTPSIGTALFNNHGQAANELLKQADIAMYQAKISGRNALRFFDPQMQASINARVALEADLRLAVAESQFILYYQPQVCHDRQIIGAEVLIRWQHPEQGWVCPSDFIPLAEETGLILPIGQWVMETACAQIKRWEAGDHTRDLQLAVNVSARQFHQSDFVEQVRQALDRNEIKPASLKLELTESLVLNDIDDTIFKMNALREIGVRFAMDDFGTGYSSLAYLTQLPLDQLKIDQSFVRNIGMKPSDSMIVQTIIGMANNLGMEVIAEGVETEAQRAFLEQHGCPVCQGYLFSKPAPLAEFEQLLKPLPS